MPRNISHRTVMRRLKFYGYSMFRVRTTLSISLVNRKKKRVASCRSKLCWTINQNWKKVIFSEETQAVIIGNNQPVYVRRKSDEIWRPECLGLRVRSQVSVMFWCCICYTSVGTLVETDGALNSEKYIETLDCHLWPVLLRISRIRTLHSRTIMPLATSLLGARPGNVNMISLNSIGLLNRQMSM